MLCILIMNKVSEKKHLVDMDAVYLAKIRRPMEG